MSKSAPANRSSGLLLFVTLLIVAILAFFSYQLLHPDFSISKYLLSKFSSPRNTSLSLTAPPRKPTPIPLSSGQGDYSISHAKSNGPSISRVIFNPLDIKKNQDLHLSVTLSSGANIKTVIGLLTTDNQTIPLTFTIKNNVTNQPQIWETTVKLPDSVSNKYILSVTGQDTNGKTTIFVAPRS